MRIGIGRRVGKTYVGVSTNKTGTVSAIMAIFYLIALPLIIMYYMVYGLCYLCYVIFIAIIDFIERDKPETEKRAYRNKMKAAREAEIDEYLAQAEEEANKPFKGFEL